MSEGWEAVADRLSWFLVGRAVEAMVYPPSVVVGVEWDSDRFVAEVDGWVGGNAVLRWSDVGVDGSDWSGADARGALVAALQAEVVHCDYECEVDFGDRRVPVGGARRHGAGSVRCRVVVTSMDDSGLELEFVPEPIISMESEARTAAERYANEI